MGARRQLQLAAITLYRLEVIRGVHWRRFHVLGRRDAYPIARPVARMKLVVDVRASRQASHADIANDLTAFDDAPRGEPCRKAVQVAVVGQKAVLVLQDHHLAELAALAR